MATLALLLSLPFTLLQPNRSVARKCQAKVLIGVHSQSAMSKVDPQMAVGRVKMGSIAVA